MRRIGVVDRTPDVQHFMYADRRLEAACSALCDIPWSTAAVFQKTVERAAEIDLPVVTVPGWYDVDDASSLAILESELAGTPPFPHAFPGANAPATRAHLTAREAPLRAGSAR